ncbi:MAG: ADP-ribosylglycohydrolase family protein [Chloroflexi bacterium]|nr:ADP-ribosylglycohydrolase family protein [Chloroflexota bacterium]
MNRREARERVLGCLLGGAIGDALGAPLEFMSLQEIRHRWGQRGALTYAPLNGRTGVITDDTQMTLWTIEGLLRARSSEQQGRDTDTVAVIHRAYLRWLHTQGVPWTSARGPHIEDPGPTGWLVTNRRLFDEQAPGNTCLSALRSGLVGSPAEPINDSKGCGGAMRVAPVGLVAEHPFELAMAVAAITHGHPSGYLAAAAFARVVADLLSGRSLPEAINAAHEELTLRTGHQETSAAMSSAVDLERSSSGTAEDVERLGGGWVAEEALAIAIYCALRATDFRSGVILAANHSGDSDSTASMTGNLLGAKLGLGGLPPDLVEGLEARDLIMEIGEDFVECFVRGVSPDPQRYPPD